MYFDIIDNAISTPFRASADASVCMADVKKNFAVHPERWQTAFQFLTHLFPEQQTEKEYAEVLSQLQSGRIVLSKDVYVNIDCYMPKPWDECRGEAHQRYIDVQYVAKGCEFIGITRNENRPVLIPYNEDADIAFYDFRPMPKDLHEATSDNFFIFFPHDIHEPCMEHPLKQPVIKLVVKIRVD